MDKEKIINEEVLKNKLKKVKENNYELKQGESYFELELQMIDSIGSIDSELRDDLIYSISCFWITGGKLNEKQLKTILSIVLGDVHILYGLMDNKENSVYKRTFSVLIIVLILYVNRKDCFLSDEEIYEVKGKLLYYFRCEKDVRGYVEGFGWAHSVAHTADALEQIVQYDLFQKQDILEILDAIKDKVCIGYYVYVDEESERLMNAVEHALKRKVLTNSEILSWIDKFKNKDKLDKHIEEFHLKVNKKQFLRSMYFRFLENEEFAFVAKKAQEILKKI